MKLNKIEAIIEAVLFSMGEAVSLTKLSNVIEQDKKTTKKIINKMIEQYNKEDRGIQIVEIDNAYQMSTKTQMYEYIKKITLKPKKIRLTEIVLETLAIIAYKQPITKVEIEQIRGVKSDHAINKLIEYNLVYDVGRMDAPGRPLLFGTTEEFLRNFGLRSLQDLPMINESEIEKFKTEAEREIQQRLEE